MAKLKAEVKHLQAELVASNLLVQTFKAQLGGYDALRTAMVNQAKAEAKDEMRRDAETRFMDGVQMAKSLIQESRGWK